MRKFAALFAVLLVGWLSAGCPTDPVIVPTGKTCVRGSDPCPTGFECYQGTCVAPCTPAQQSSNNPDAAPAFNALSAVECHCNSDCPSFQLCHADPYWLSQGLRTVCETVCDAGGVTACLDPNTVCDATACTLRTCGPDQIDAKCDAAQTLDGTCLPLLDGGAGVCLQGSNTGTGQCVQTADRSKPSALCPAGDFCQTDPSGGTASCYRVCNPQNMLQSQCAGGSCWPLSAQLGYCTDGGP